MSMNSPTQHDLNRVHFENVRDNQIGGETDGITPEVAEAIGYFPVMLSEATVEAPTTESAVAQPRVIPADSKARLDAFHAEVAGKREQAGELPPAERPNSDRGSTTRYVVGRRMPFHASGK